MKMCDECEENKAEYICPECGSLYCENCADEVCIECAPRLDRIQSKDKKRRK